MKLLLVVNGVDAPLLRQFGCDCERCCLAGERQANTSVSLIGLTEAGETAAHLLVDAGAGVVDSLVQMPYLRGARARLDWVLLTHWHPDHTADLNRLCSSYHLTRVRAGLPAPRPRVWCRAGTAAWMETLHAYEWHNFLAPVVAPGGEPPGTLLPPVDVGLPGVCITPVSVSHYTADRAVADAGEVRYGCAAFVVETAETKTVLLWDIDSENQWLWQPQTAAQETAVARLAEADYLFVDTSFWRAQARRTTHPSFENVQRIAASLRPRQTLLMHLSGHPDPRGEAAWGWGNGRWSAEASRAWATAGLPGGVRVPGIGETFVLAADLKPDRAL